MNGVCSDNDSEVVHVDITVDATINPVSPLCENDPAITLTSVTAGGTWSGNGVVGNTFDPSLAGPGQHLITHFVTNGACSHTDTEIIIVDSEIDAGVSPAGPYCVNIAPVTLSAAAVGGTWSGSGIIDAVAGIFAPATAGAGNHIITYTVSNGACGDVEHITIHIDDAPNASINPVPPMCETAGNVTLTAATAGGAWSGNGVVGNIFNPTLAGQGNHTITYTILNGVCSASDQIVIHVDTMPDATVTPAGPFCEDFQFAYLQAVSSGGTWSGTGITNAALGQFSPLFSGPGDFLITYTVVNGLCSDNDSFTIHVDDYLDPTITPISNICQSGPQITLHAATPGGVWAGQGIIDPINGILDPSLVVHGDNTMTYTITNGSCVSTDLHIYQVDAQVDATITSNPGPVCVNASPFQLTSLNPGGVWSGTGIGNLPLAHLYQIRLAQVLML